MGTDRSRTRLDPDVRREQILDAAEAVFDGRDPNDVTFEQVADAAGVSRALVYNYFADKGALIAGVYLRAFARLSERLAEAHHSTSTGQQRLEAIVQCYFEFAREHAGSARLIAAAEAMDHPQVVVARRRRHEEIVARAQRVSPESRLLTRGIVAMLETAALQWIEQPEIPIERAEAIFTTLAWSGVVALTSSGLVPLEPLPDA